MVGHGLADSKGHGRPLPTLNCQSLGLWGEWNLCTKAGPSERWTPWAWAPGTQPQAWRVHILHQPEKSPGHVHATEQTTEPCHWAPPLLPVTWHSQAVLWTGQDDPVVSKPKDELKRS